MISPEDKKLNPYGGLFLVGDEGAEEPRFARCEPRARAYIYQKLNKEPVALSPISGGPGG